MGPVEWLLTLVVLALIGREVFHRRVGLRARWEPSTWAESVGLVLTKRNLEFVRSYIRRTQALRIAGGLMGVATPVVYSAYAGEELPAPFDFGLFTGLAGYLLGAVLAEVVVRRARTDPPAALLVPRHVDDYLPAFHSMALRGSAALAVFLFVIYLFIARGGPNDRADAFLSPFVAVPTIVAIVLGVEILQRYIVRQPQPAAESDLVDADDAIRSASVHALAGAGIALELLISSVVILAIGVISDIRLVRWTLPWVAVICLGAALGSWTDLTQPRHWKVRRPQLRPGA